MLDPTDNRPTNRELSMSFEHLYFPIRFFGLENKSML